jgi:pimeloyl-ACP methyl ester carboxylesterase
MGATSAVHAASSGVAVDAVVTISAPAMLHDPPVTEPMRRLRGVWDSAWGRAGLRWLLGVRVVHPRRWQAPPHPLHAARLIDVPLLVVHGTDDGYFPASDAHDLASASPDARLWLRPDGVGHAEDGFSAAFCRRLGHAVAAVATTGAFPAYLDET